jgi:cysteine desulfurase
MSGIYLDYQSCCPVDPRVEEFANHHFGNPSALHSTGITARMAIEEARAKVAQLINAEDPGTIMFTGSATEANNLAIHETAARNAKDGKKVLASSIEHISVVTTPPNKFGGI